VDSPAGGILSSLPKKNKAGGTVTVATCAPVVSVAPSVEPALKKQANVTDAANILDNKELEKKSKEELMERLEEESEEDSDKELEEEGLDQHSDQRLE